MQSRLLSLLETIANLGSGFILSVIVYLSLSGWLIGNPNILAGTEAVITTIFFTATSSIRSYTIRRLFVKYDKQLTRFVDGILLKYRIMWTLRKYKFPTYININDFEWEN